MTPPVSKREPFRLPRVYPILDTATLAERRITPLEAARAAIRGGAEILQLRHKKQFTREVFDEARRIAELCQSAGVLFVMNDRADLARLLDAGLHVGQDDLRPADARQILGNALPLGYSTHNLKQLREAAAEPVDYIAIGPIFGTVNKQNPDPMVGIEPMRQISEGLRQPLVAIGGITLDNAARLYETGVASVAVIGDLYALGDTVDAIEQRIAEWRKRYPDSHA